MNVGRGFTLRPFFYLLNRSDVLHAASQSSARKESNWDEPFLTFTHIIPERTRHKAGLSGAWRRRRHARGGENMPGSTRGRRSSKNLGAPKPDSHSRSRSSTKPKQDRSCPQPEIQKLVPALLAGELATPGRRSDRRRMEQHLRRCGACRDICVEHAHRVVTIPFLKAAAEGLGITVQDLQRRLQRTASRAG